MKLISRYALLFYIVAIAALPLSYIHIEDMFSPVCFTGDNDHRENLHLMLHELFYLHLSRNSDHVYGASLGEVFLPGGKIVEYKSLFGLDKGSGPPGPGIAAQSGYYETAALYAVSDDTNPLSISHSRLFCLSPPTIRSES